MGTPSFLKRVELCFVAYLLLTLHSIELDETIDNPRGNEQKHTFEYTNKCFFVYCVISRILISHFHIQ